MKKSVKLISIILIAAMLVMSLTTVVQAAGGTAGSFAEDLANGGINNPESATGLMGLAKQIIGIINVIGVVVAVIILLVLGIKYMTGSVEEKAEYKKTFVPYLIGALLVFGAPTIVNVIVNLATISANP